MGFFYRSRVGMYGNRVLVISGSLCFSRIVNFLGYIYRIVWKVSLRMIISKGYIGFVLE